MKLKLSTKFLAFFASSRMGVFKKRITNKANDEALRETESIFLTLTFDLPFVCIREHRKTVKTG